MSRGYRKQTAYDLFSMAVKGPAFINDIDQKYRSQYDLWAKTWIIPALRKLIKEIPQESKDPTP